jgi:hypothetical protein
MLATATVGACAHPRDFFDAGANDHHRWNSNEDIAYRRWEAERQVQHVEFERRSADDQRAYWSWRHSHP